MPVKRNATDPAHHRAARAGTARRDADGDHHVGTALRAAYQQTVEEAIPSDLLDLLGKLR